MVAFRGDIYINNAILNMNLTLRGLGDYFVDFKLVAN